jgi:hypothetical protein
MDKKAITAAVIEEVKSKYDVDRALKAWWWRSYAGNNNARLTITGHKAFSKAMRAFTFDCELEHTGANMKRLAKLTTPYFADYKDQTITIYSEQLATMIKLYPSFNRYLDLLQ